MTTLDRIDSILNAISSVLETEREKEYRSLFLEKHIQDPFLDSKRRINDIECCICFEDVDSLCLEGKICPRVTVCGHMFHETCLMKHTKTNKKCPSCRHEF